MDDGLVHGVTYHTRLTKIKVLILVVVDDGLVHSFKLFTIMETTVLILVVVDDGLVLY